MGLNDEALEELKETPEGTGITDPGEVLNTSNTATITLLADDGISSEESDRIIELLDSDVEVLIKTTDEKEAELYNMEEVAQVIMSKESISQADAEFIVRAPINPAIKEELVQEVGPIGSFTQTPSTTNLQAVKQFLMEKVNGIQMEVHGAYATILKGRIERIFEIQQTLTGRIDDLITVANFLRTQALEDLQKATVSKNLTYWVQIPNKDEESEKPYRDILVNLSLCSLNGYSIGAAQAALEKVVGFNKAMREEVREIINNYPLLAILKKAEDTTEAWGPNPYETKLTDFIPDERSGESQFMSLTYSKLLSILSSELLLVWLEGAKKTVSSDLEAIKNRLEKAATVGSSVINFTKEELQDNETLMLAKSTVDYLRRAMEVNTTMGKLESFYKLSSVILEQFRKVL